MKDNFPDTEPVFVKERAQPVEGPREPLYRLKACDKCGKEFTYDYECHCGFSWHYVSAPVEGVERVTDDAPARVEPEESGLEWEHEFGCTAAGKVGHSPDCCCAAIAAAQPAKHTDDRPAETIPIPGDLTELYEDSESAIQRELIERIGRREAMLDKFSDNSDRLNERTGRAETRIEVLEAALRQVIEHVNKLPKGHYSPWLTWWAKEYAALAAPSGEQP